LRSKHYMSRLVICGCGYCCIAACGRGRCPDCSRADSGAGRMPAMSTSTKLSLKWFLIGMAVYVGTGVAFFFFFPESKMMNEPPPYAAAFFTLMVVVPGIVKNAMGAGAKNK
jgi:hypothetical protein